MKNLREEQFIRNNSNIWRELEELSTIVNKKGIKSLGSKDVKRFLHLFRQTSHHLAYARTHYKESTVIGYLNSLLGKCHSNIYAVRKVSPGEFIKYIIYGFPNALRENRWFVAASTAFFTLGFLIAFLLVSSNSQNAGIFLPAHMVEGVKSGAAGNGGQWNYPLMSSYIMVNNISVSLRAFVFGITFGLGTIYVLFSNGALLGALTSLIYMYGSPLKYWSLILPHGVIELTAIFISGAAGLMIAKYLLIPGELSRRHSLIYGAKKSASLILGVVLMLVIAGIIEGFYTPLNIAETTKLVFAGITGIALAIYFGIPYFAKKQY